MPPTVRVLFKYPRSIRAATAAADRLPRFLLPGFREATRITAPPPCCKCTCCDALYMHSFSQQRGSLSHDETWSVASQQCTVNTTCVQTLGTCVHISICACHPRLRRSVRTGSGSQHSSVAACLVAQAIVDPAFKPCGATRTHRDDATPSKRLLLLRPRVCPLLTTI